jgi:hypothetical protein
MRASGPAKSFDSSWTSILNSEARLRLCCSVAQTIVFCRLRLLDSLLLLNHDEPRGDDRTLWAAATSACRGAAPANVSTVATVVYLSADRGQYTQTPNFAPPARAVSISFSASSASLR